MVRHVERTSVANPAMTICTANFNLACDPACMHAIGEFLFYRSGDFWHTIGDFCPEATIGFRSLIFDKNLSRTL